MNNKPKFSITIKAINPKHTELAAVAEKVANEDKELMKKLEKGVLKIIKDEVSYILGRNS